MIRFCSRWQIGLVLLALALPACAPRQQTLGPAFRMPAISADSSIMEDAARLPMRQWVAEKPQAVLVAVHGFNDYSRAFEETGNWFAQRGVSVYAYDQRGFGLAPGHGLWAGDDVMVQDLKTIVSLLRTRHPALPVFVLGSSMGGAVTIAAAVDDAFAADGIVLAAPAVWGWTSMNLFYKSTLWLSAHLVPQLSLTGEGLERWPTDNIEMLRTMATDPLVIKETRLDTVYGLVGLMDRAYLAVENVAIPTLYLYGAKDQIVPREPTQKVVGRFAGNATYVEYEQGWHMLLRDVQRETVWQDILQWMDRQGEVNH